MGFFDRVRGMKAVTIKEPVNLSKKCSILPDRGLDQVYSRACRYRARIQYLHCDILNTDMHDQTCTSRLIKTRLIHDSLK
jgi:hypothetical protein